MDSVKISNLPEVSSAQANDILPIVNVVAPGDPDSYVTSKITVVNFLNSIVVDTASYADTASYVEAGAIVHTSSYSITSSYLSGSSAIVDNLTVFGTGSITYLHVAYETASVVYSSGSNKFGDAFNDVHEFTGSVGITGSLQATGDVTLSGSLEINKTTTPNFFLIKNASFEALKVTGSGVLVFGGFSSTPTAVAGGMFYSASGEFYLGF